MNHVQVRPALKPLCVSFVCAFSPIVLVALTSVILKNSAGSIYFDCLNAAGMLVGILIAMKLFAINWEVRRWLRFNVSYGLLALLLGMSFAVVQHLISFKAGKSASGENVHILLTFLDSRSILPFLLLFCPVVLFYPILEEIIFRGLVQNAFLEYLDHPWLAMVLTSALFAFMHLTGRLEWLPVAHTFGMGLVMSLLTFRSSSLLPAMLLHASANFTEIVLQAVTWT